MPVERTASPQSAALILGVGDAFTCRHFGSSSLLRSSRGLVLVDCPDLIHRALHDACAASGWNASAADIDDIIITHLHGDHCNGLESFGFLRRLLRMRSSKTTIPRVHATQTVIDRLWERLAPAMSAPIGGGRPSVLSDFFEVHAISPDRATIIAGLTVHCRFTKHPIPTIGLLISDGTRTLGWSGDTPFEQAHIDWLAHADVIVHESNLGPAHTPIESLNALPPAIRSKLRLIHLHDDFDPAATPIPLLREGQVLVW